MNNCPFCDRNLIANTVRINEEDIPCQREIYANDRCYAVLAPEQYTHGHTLLILHDGVHREDIASDMPTESLTAFSKALNLISNTLKHTLKNNRGDNPKRIYVAMLSDGLPHLHAHLIPRYSFDELDKFVYRLLFTQRDGKDEIDKSVDSGSMGGFWYVGLREANHLQSEFNQKSPQERARILEQLAKELRTQITTA